MARQKIFTDELLARARQMAGTRSWKEIGRELGVCPRSLQSRLSQIKHSGKRPGPDDLWRPYSREELLRALNAHQAGATWAELGERFNRPEESLRSTVSLFRRGLWSDTYKLQKQQELAVMIEMAEAGARPSVIAKKLGKSYHNVYMRLKWHGYDAEVRREYREAA